MALSLWAALHCGGATLSRVRGGMLRVLAAPQVHDDVLCCGAVTVLRHEVGKPLGVTAYSFHGHHAPRQHIMACTTSSPRTATASRAPDPVASAAERHRDARQAPAWVEVVPSAVTAISSLTSTSVVPLVTKGVSSANVPTYGEPWAPACRCGSDARGNDHCT